MNGTFGIGQIAGALGVSTQATAKRARKESWAFASGKRARGGGIKKLFALESLPRDVRLAIAVWVASEAGRRRTKHHGRPEPGPYHDACMAGVAAYAALPAGRAKTRADAKLALLDAWRAFREASGLGARASQAEFAARFNRGEIPLADDLRPLVKRLTAPTLRRWLLRERREGPAALAGLTLGRHRKGTGRIDSSEALRDAILGLLGTHPDWSVAHVYAALEARAEGMPLPAMRTVQRWAARFKKDNPQLALNLADPDAWRHRYQAAAGSASARIERLNQLWELDSTPADVMLQGGRHAVVGVVDVYSRRAMVQVSKTSRSTAIAALLRRAIIAWGVPEAVKTDNGKDYVSRHIKGILTGLGIAHELCPPFTPEAKPHIERFFGTFSRGLLPLLPGYIGPSVARRKSIRARQAADAGDGEPICLELTADELQRECDRWCESVYGRKAHRGLGGKSPFRKAQDYRGAVQRVRNVRALDMALAAPAAGGGTRMVRHGMVSVGGRDYTAPELGPHTGERVYVRVDESDLGRVYLYQRNAFLCVAENPELCGVNRAELAARVKAAQQSMLRKQKADIRRKARRTAAQDAGRAILAHAEAEAARVVAFTPPGVPHLTPELEESGKAAAARAKARRPRAADADEREEAAARAALDADKRLLAGLRLRNARLAAANDD